MQSKRCDFVKLKSKNNGISNIPVVGWKTLFAEFIATQSNINALTDDEAILCLQVAASIFPLDDNKHKQSIVQLIERVAPIGIDSICRRKVHTSLPIKVCVTLIDACTTYEFLRVEYRRQLVSARQHRYDFFRIDNVNRCQQMNGRLCCYPTIIASCIKCHRYTCQNHHQLGDCIVRDHVYEMAVRARVELLD